MSFILYYNTTELLQLFYHIFRARFLQHESSKVGKIVTESLAQPGLLRAGTNGMFHFI